MHATTIIYFLTAGLAGLSAAAPAAGPGKDAVRKSKNTCTAKNAVFFDSYGVYGANFHGDVVGAWGEHLRNQLKGCGGGTTTGWTFEYNDNKKKDWYDWKARFNLPLGQRKCAMHAVQAVGGQAVECK